MFLVIYPYRLSCRRYNNFFKIRVIQQEFNRTKPKHLLYQVANKISPQLGCNIRKHCLYKGYCPSAELFFQYCNRFRVKHLCSAYGNFSHKLAPYFIKKCLCCRLKLWKHNLINCHCLLYAKYSYRDFNKLGCYSVVFDFFLHNCSSPIAGYLSSISP